MPETGAGQEVTSPLRILLAQGGAAAPGAEELLAAGLQTPFELTHCPLDDERILAALAGGRFDAVLIECPRIANSLPSVRTIRSRPSECAVVVLVDSPCTRDHTCLSAIHAGAEDALIKSEISPGQLARALLFAIERTRAEVVRSAQLAAAREAQLRAEEAKRRATFAASASSTLASSLDLTSTLDDVAKLATSALADLCIVDLLDEDGKLKRVAVIHRDPALQEMARDLLDFQLDPERPHLTFAALQTREPVLVTMDSEKLDALAQNARHREILARLAPGNHLALPLIARDRLLGALLFARDREREPFSAEDRSVALDLAKRAALAIDNSRLYTEARDAIAARNSVLRIVAHDLRNPLNAITMTANLLLELPHTPEELVQRAQMIRRAGRQMDLLIQDLLDVVRFDAGHFALTRELISPATLARQIVEMNVPLANARSIELTCQAEADLPPIDVDTPRVLQVLGNLIDNAIKFTPRGGSITVAVQRREQHAIFSVRDTGIGLSAEEVDSLFRPFWQSRRGGRQGAGLGLSIAKVIVEAHGGRIWAESEPEQGSTFFATFPLARERRVRG